MQDREYLHFVALNSVNSDVVWVKHILPGAEDFPRCAYLLGLQSIDFFAKLLYKSFSSFWIVFSDVGGDRIEAANGPIRPAQFKRHF